MLIVVVWQAGDRVRAGSPPLDGEVLHHETPGVGWPREFVMVKLDHDGMAYYFAPDRLELMT